MFLISFLISVVVAAPTDLLSIGFNIETVIKVRANLLQIATHSWEIGTALESLTELEWLSLSVFSNTFPPPTHLGLLNNATDVRSIATQIVQAKPADSLPFLDGDGAVGDPASVGVAVLLANWTRPDLLDTSISQAAAGQLQYLLQDAPRTPDGAISQRVDQVQLWADFVYMAPPFIAYYGALQGGDYGSNLLQVAYDQCRLYRQYLRDDGGLWRHITLGTGQDSSHWGTGNGWAAAGMLRVLETIRLSQSPFQFVEQQANLTSWIQEIVSAAWSFQKPNGTLYNYIDDDTSFADSSSTALLASVTFRIAALTGDFTYIPAANRALSVIESSVNADGWLLNTVDPETFNTPSQPGSYSPEGQAFVLLLQAAHRDLLKLLFLTRA
ncbi:Unsaturated rhamnogalacturonyl hydrolase YesR [Grifola frondosa]|uniref:Unsaturated rhamnogalacturonyl hydrolase YesR n=1 Tax=Grifola frondosa TaxID=5627 RepID=A0A1C7MGV9_GRIFR|nr:Unsaturated rhamnogalacturonyl hydrolase YesR [Grifola frondosa]